MVRRVTSYLPFVGVILVALVLLPRLVGYAQHSWDMLNFPWQIDYDEGINLNASWLLSQGVNIYHPNPPDHFISSMYPPLYFVLNAAAIKLVGLNLASGRLLAFIGAIGVGAALWAWVYVETKRHVAGALSALMWFSLGPVYVWSTFYKQDMLALAFGLVGVAMVAHWAAVRRLSSEAPSGKGGNASLFWAIVPLLLSFWVKQSSLAPMAAAGLFVLLVDWRLAIRWTLTAIGSIIIPFAALDLLLKGGLHTHVLAFDYYGRSAARLGKNLDALWTQHAPLALCGFGYVVLSAWEYAKKSEITSQKSEIPLSALYLLVSIPASLLSNSLPTANYNHLLDILAPLCLTLGVALGTVWRRTRGGGGNMRARVAWTSATLVVLVLALIQADILYNKPGQAWYSPLSMPLAERAERMEKLSEIVKQAQGDILSEDNWLLLKNGKRVIYDDPAAMSALANAGAWNQSALLQDINRHKFSLVVLQYDLTTETYNPRWSDKSLKALKANYEIRFRDALFTHVPRPPGDAPDTEAGCTLQTGSALQGYTFRATTANHGDSLPLSLYWEVTSKLTLQINTKYFVRLLDSAGAVKWSADLSPGQAAGKTLPGSTDLTTGVRDDISIPVASELPYGHYRLALGGYTIDGARKITPLQMKCPTNIKPQPDGTIPLASIEVVERWGR